MVYIRLSDVPLGHNAFLTMRLLLPDNNCVCKPTSSEADAGGTTGCRCAHSGVAACVQPGPDSEGSSIITWVEDNELMMIKIKLAVQENTVHAQVLGIKRRVMASRIPDDQFSDETLTDNQCRNPDGKAQIWCYTGEHSLNSAVSYFEPFPKPLGG